MSEQIKSPDLAQTPFKLSSEFEGIEGVKDMKNLGSTVANTVAGIFATNNPKWEEILPDSSKTSQLDPRLIEKYGWCVRYADLFPIE